MAGMDSRPLAVLTRIWLIVIGALLVAALVSFGVMRYLVTIAGRNSDVVTDLTLPVLFMCFCVPLQMLLAAGLATIQLTRGHAYAPDVSRTFVKTILVVPLLTPIIGVMSMLAGLQELFAGSPAMAFVASGTATLITYILISQAASRTRPHWK